MERLHSQPVSREEQRAPLAIPQREREHAAKPLDTGLAPCLPCMDDDFGVALRAKSMAELDEIGDQRSIIVDLAVVNNDDGAVLVPQRLLSRLQIDDRQPPVAESKPGLDM